MSRNRWRTAVFSALFSAFSCAFAMTAPASDGIRIIGESESEQQVQTADTAPSQGAAQSSSTAALAGAGGAEAQAETEADAAAEEGQRPLNPADEGITAEEAVREARSLYSQMQHYADVNDNTQFAALFEDGADAQTVQDQLQAVKSSLADLKGLDSHSDLCFFDPTQDSTQSPYYFAVALCDYDVDASGAAAWYSTLMRLAKYPSGWKASVIPAGELLARQYPEAFRSAQSAGRNAVDLYPSFALRFASGASFRGALYALPNLAWQEENGDLCVALWIANGTETSKWCDSIDLIMTDTGLGKIASVNVPVQVALVGGQSELLTCTVPASHVSGGTDAWTSVNVQSNLKYQ